MGKTYTVMDSLIAVGQTVRVMDGDRLVTIEITKIISCARWNANMRAIVEGTVKG